MPRTIVVALALSMLAPVAAASGHPAAGRQAGGQKPKPAVEAPAPDAPVVATPVAVNVPRPPAQLANLRLELTITDQRGPAPASPKTVSMLVADRYNGRIRTSGYVRVGAGHQPITLNVDAQPEMLKDGRIRVQVSFEYRAQTAEGTQEDNQPSNLTEAFNVILEDGKPLLVSQSADPASDRKVRVDLKASVVK